MTALTVDPSKLASADASAVQSASEVSFLNDAAAAIVDHATTLNANAIKTKWLYAATKPTVHMEVDFEGLTGLAPLALDANDATIAARATAMKTAWNAHLPGVGTIFADGEHKAADAANVVATADAVTLGDAEALGAALLASVIGHGNQAGVHFKDDTTTGGTAAVVPQAWDSGPHTADNLNALKLEMQGHLSAGSV